jgi:tRNA G18 (ribose-2'-O)-methylase SpoU
MIPDLLKPFSKEFKNHLKGEEIIIESYQAVDFFIRSGGQVRYLVYEEGFDISTLPSDIPRHCYSRQELSSFYGYRFHVGVMALGEKPSNIPLEDLGEKILIFNGITGPENIGSLVRLAAAFGFQSLMVDTSSCSPFTSRCIRVSTGHLFQCRVHETLNLTSSLLRLKELGYAIAASELSDKAISVYDYEPPKKIAVIFGSEGRGVEEGLLELVDQIIQVPQAPGFSSLNVSHSAAIVLSELFFKSINKTRHL